MLSIVIVNYKTRELLRQCLDSVRRRCAGAQVIVVDNASNDGSVEMVASDFPEMICVPLAKNVGFAGGNNAGLPLATGECVVLLNSDTVLEDDSLQRCEAFLRANPEVGAVSPRLVGIDGVPQRSMYPFPSLRDKVRQALRRTAADRDGGTGWLAGTTLVIRREALAAVDGRLDDTFFMYWEDADFSARLQRAGWGVAVCDEACVLHYGGASGGGADADRRSDLHAWFSYGEHRWFAKHRPAWEAAAFWLLDLADVLRCLVRGAVRPDRRSAWRHARAVAGVLGRRLLGLRPPLPGASARPVPPSGVAS
jgi:GT2 family glycosyltransferase